MLLKNVIDSPCGLRFVIDQLELQSGFSRRWLLDRPMMPRANDIEAAKKIVAGTARSMGVTIAE